MEMTPDLYGQHVATLRRKHEVRFAGRTAINFEQYSKILAECKFLPEANGCEPLPMDGTPEADASIVAAIDAIAEDPAVVLGEKLATATMEIEDLEGKLERLSFGHISEFVRIDFEGWGCIAPGTDETRDGVKSLWYGRPDPDGPVYIVLLADSLQGADHPTDVDAEGWVALISPEHWASMAIDMKVVAAVEGEADNSERDAGRELIDSVMQALGLGVPVTSEGAKWADEIIAAIEKLKAPNMGTLEVKVLDMPEVQEELQRFRAEIEASVQAKDAEIAKLKEELKAAKTKKGGKAEKPEGGE